MSRRCVGSNCRRQPDDDARSRRRSRCPVSPTRPYRQFAPIFNQLGLTAVAGWRGGRARFSQAGYGLAHTSMQPGESVAAVLVSGDMTMTGGGTVTYNDGKHVWRSVIRCSISGPWTCPLPRKKSSRRWLRHISRRKWATRPRWSGALRQDRHSGIARRAGGDAQMIPVTMHVALVNCRQCDSQERRISISMFSCEQKWTPYLMMATLFNSLSNLNDFSEEATYRLTRRAAGRRTRKSAAHHHAGACRDARSDAHASGRLVGRQIQPPVSKFVEDAKTELRKCQRRSASRTAHCPDRVGLDCRQQSDAGTEVPVKVFLRPYRGERMEREVKSRFRRACPRRTPDPVQRCRNAEPIPEHC